MNSLAAVFAAVLVVVSLPLVLAGATLGIYSVFAKSARAAHASHGLGAVSLAALAVGSLLLGVYLAAAMFGVLALLFACWWWLTRPAQERAS